MKIGRDIERRDFTLNISDWGEGGSVDIGIGWLKREWLSPTSLPSSNRCSLMFSQRFYNEYTQHNILSFRFHWLIEENNIRLFFSWKDCDILIVTNNYVILSPPMEISRLKERFFSYIYIRYHILLVLYEFHFDVNPKFALWLDLNLRTWRVRVQVAWVFSLRIWLFWGSAL